MSQAEQTTRAVRDTESGVCLSSVTLTTLPEKRTGESQAVTHRGREEMRMDEVKGSRVLGLGEGRYCIDGRPGRKDFRERAK